MKKYGSLLAVYGIAFGLPIVMTGRVEVTWLSAGLATVATIVAVRGWLDPRLQSHDPDVRPHYTSKETREW